LFSLSCFLAVTGRDIFYRRLKNIKLRRIKMGQIEILEWKQRQARNIQRQNLERRATWWTLILAIAILGFVVYGIDTVAMRKFENKGVVTWAR